MLSPKIWLFRHLRQLRLALVLCLVVSYGALVLLSIPITAYFEQMRGTSKNPSMNPEDSTADVLASNTEMSAGPWNLPVLPVLLNTWRCRNTSRCDGRLELFANEFARLRSVVVDRRYCVAKAKGGEDVSEVLRQNEQAEYYSVIKSCFQLDCAGAENVTADYRFKRFNYLQTWLVQMKTLDVVKIDRQTAIGPGFTIAFMRREYANLYHTVNDWYNLFLMMVFFRRRPGETNVLLVDAHPKGSLDAAWPVLFNSTRRLSATPQRTVYPEMVWGMQGYNSVLKRTYRYNDTPPLLEDFRRFVLDRFRLEATRKLDCSNISVLFIWRHDYVAHPRNPTGEVQRKIANEEELLVELRRRHPRYRIEGVQIDKFSIRDQLRLVSDADVLVGMHGAGLSHALFVQPYAGTVELVPRYYGIGNDHFANLARWRGLGSVRWSNTDRRLELEHYRTVVPVQVVDGLVNKVVGQICLESQNARLEKRIKTTAVPRRRSKTAAAAAATTRISKRAGLKLSGRPNRRSKRSKKRLHLKRY